MSNVPGAEGDKIVCPSCEGENIETTSRERRYQCEDCDRVFEPDGRFSIE
jgi:transposase-like protein